MRTASIETGIFRIVIVSLNRLCSSNARRCVISDLNRLRALRLSIKREGLERDTLDGLRRVNGFAAAPRLRAGLGDEQRGQNSCEEENTKHASAGSCFQAKLFHRVRL